MDQWNRIESQEIDSHEYSQLIFNKGAKSTQHGKDSLVNKWCWNNWISTCKKNMYKQMLQPSQKNNSKCIIDIHKKHETIKLLEDNIGENLDDFVDNEDYVYTTPRQDP